MLRNFILDYEVWWERSEIFEKFCEKVQKLHRSYFWVGVKVVCVATTA